jgi:hypothetical protein
MLLSRSRKFVINLGNYESFATEATVSDISFEFASEFDAANKKAEHLLDIALKADLEKAGEISSVANTYVLTWLEENKQ